MIAKETESRSAVAWGWGWEWGLTVRGQEGPYRGEENVPKLV